MKNIYIPIMWFFVACSPGIIVHTDHDRDVNIRTYSTYGWAENKDIESKNNPLYYNELNDKRIKKIVNNEFIKRGYIFVEKNPELLIHYHLLTEDQTELRVDPYGVYGPYWMRPPANAFLYTEGTVIIDIMETKTNNLAWRGWATSVLNDHELKKELIKEAITLILKEYPYRANINGEKQKQDIVP